METQRVIMAHDPIWGQIGPGYKWIIAQFWLTVGPLGPWTHLLVISKCIITIDIVGRWWNLHIGPLACEVKATYHSRECKVEGFLVPPTLILLQAKILNKEKFTSWKG